MRYGLLALLACSGACVFELPPLADPGAGGGGGGQGGDSTTTGTGGAASVPRYELALAYAPGTFTVDHGGVPMLVLLDATRFDYDLAAADGGDLRAFDGDGSPLPLEIERWDPSGQSVVWVRLPAVSTSGGSFVLRFGDPNAPAGPGLDATWADYSAVYHLGDAAPQTEVADALGLHPGAGTGVDAQPGYIGTGLHFDGVTSRVDVGDAPTWEVGPGEVKTVSLWFQRDVEPGEMMRGMALMQARRSAGCQGWIMRVLGDSFANTNVATHVDGCSQSGFATSNPGLGSYDDESWHHIAAVFDRRAGMVYHYRDAMLVGEAPLVTTGDFSSGEAVFGLELDGESDRFEGIMDEARVRLGGADGPWFQAEMAIAADAILDFGTVQRVEP